MGTGVADGGLQGQGGCLACRQCSRHWGRGQTLSRRYRWGMSRSRPGRTRGPIAQRDDPCKEPGSRAKLCSGTRCGSPPARVLFSASPRDISQPPPQALFSPAWEGVVVPPFPPPFWEVSSDSISVWSVPGEAGWRPCSAHHPPPHTHTHVRFCWFLSHFTNLRAGSPIFGSLRHKGLRGSTRADGSSLFSQ